jgi:cis-3-alkyl-4-acyloxetan-2-one decarboxylase
MTKQIDLSGFKHLYPYESHYLDLDGLKYHYLDEGKGDPIVMLHGNPTWSFYYRSLVNSLSGDYRTIVPDHIGCGLSDKPNDSIYDYRLKNRVDDLGKLLDHLGIDNNITLIVHDWGGMIGMAYALRDPERIKRLVISNTAGFFTPNDKGIPLRLWLIRHIAPFAVPAVLGCNIFAFSALYMASSKKLSKDAKAGLTAPYNSWSNRIATLKFVQDIPVKESDPSYELVDSVSTNLHKLSGIPKLFLWGENDFVFTMEFFKEWKRRFPNDEFHTFPEAGHYLLEDVPEKIAPLVNDFLRNHPI